MPALGAGRLLRPLFSGGYGGWEGVGCAGSEARDEAWAYRYCGARSAAGAELGRAGPVCAGLLWTVCGFQSAEQARLLHTPCRLPAGEATDVNKVCSV